jgi:hypothetical protein
MTFLFQWQQWQWFSNPIPWDEETSVQPLCYRRWKSHTYSSQFLLPSVLTISITTKYSQHRPAAVAQWLNTRLIIPRLMVRILQHTPGERKIAKRIDKSVIQFQDILIKLNHCHPKHYQYFFLCNLG